MSIKEDIKMLDYISIESRPQLTSNRSNAQGPNGVNADKSDANSDMTTEDVVGNYGGDDTERRRAYKHVSRERTVRAYKVMCCNNNNYNTNEALLQLPA